MKKTREQDGYKIVTAPGGVWPPYPVKYGDKCVPVLVAQAILAMRGYYDGYINGTFCAKTQEAVEAFQTAKALPITGEIDENTWRRLLSLDA